MLTDRRTDGRTDNGRKVITIAHPEQSSGELTTSQYEGPAKSFVTVFRLLQCYVLSNIFFITNLQSIPPLLKHIFVTFLPSREKQINSLLLVSVGDTDK